MSSCSNNPTKLKIVTDDIKFWDLTNKKWYFEGDLYFTVHCTPNIHITKEYLPSGPFMKMEGPQHVWDFCNNNNCDNASNFIISFTFKPESPNPLDYISFLVDYNEVIQKPVNQLPNLELDVELVASIDGKNVVEVWLSKGISKGIFVNLPQLPPKTDYTYYLTIAVIVFLLILFLLFLYRHNYFEKGVNYFKNLKFKFPSKKSSTSQVQSQPNNFPHSLPTPIPVQVPVYTPNSNPVLNIL